jgi:nucleoside-diphosphate-sugar epimerase
LENLVSVIAPQAVFGGFYAGKRILVTGHTGFKGGWLALWLHRLGATVHGYALNPPTEPSLFESAGIGTALATDTRADLADLARLKVALDNAEPEIVFHLAAQPLVLASYRDPLGTLATNVMGTANVLEAVRAVHTVRALVLIMKSVEGRILIARSIRSAATIPTAPAKRGPRLSRPVIVQASFRDKTITQPAWRLSGRAM